MGKPDADEIEIAADALSAVTQWQPIETAPRDKCHRFIICGKWLGEPFVTMAEEYGRPPTLWSNIQPTHWMPLPEPPQPL
jgi:hypothetical protein